MPGGVIYSKVAKRSKLISEKNTHNRLCHLNDIKILITTGKYFSGVFKYFIFYFFIFIFKINAMYNTIQMEYSWFMKSEEALGITKKLAYFRHIIICHINYINILDTKFLLAKQYCAILFVLDTVWPIPAEKIAPTIKCLHFSNTASILARKILSFHCQCFCNIGVSLQVLSI